MQIMFLLFIDTYITLVGTIEYFNEIFYENCQSPEERLPTHKGYRSNNLQNIIICLLCQKRKYIFLLYFL